jgi:tetratricopeptide (TPR) repeat protein
VYEVLDRTRGGLRALKLLDTADPAARYRFKREFRLVADLAHPNVVAFDELFTDQDDWFFTMELVDGVPLTEFLGAGSGLADIATLGAGPSGSIGSATDTGVLPVPPSPVVVDAALLRETFAQLAAALAAIHRVGIVHRDIKPSNVLVTGDRRVVLLDFGIAGSATLDTGTMSRVIGTPAYMPPEHVFGLTLSPASDWYSVGVMLYETLTGRRPFSGGPLEMMLAKQMAPPLPDGESPCPDLTELAIELLDPDPSKRPGGADILRRLTREPPLFIERSTGAESTGDPPLVGRELHLRALDAAFDRARAGGTVVAVLPGRSGAGKTALMRRFVQQLHDAGTPAVVIGTRCHEREAVPYKAVDGLVDGVTRYLQRLSDIEAARLLPRDAPLIARLFPVFLRVREVERTRSRAHAPLDSVELRRRAAHALRELLERISDRTPLVVTIDDLQWGDLDSASLLHELLRPPDPPPLLLVLAYRVEDEEAPLVRALRQPLLRDAAGRDVRMIAVEALTQEEARELARRELTMAADLANALAGEIARESRGNPFFVHELVRHVAAIGGAARLQTVITERVGTLPDAARQLLIAFALSAQPASVAVAAAAAGIEHDAWESVRTLRLARLVRVRESEREEVEPYHDRIRETIAASVDGQPLREWHARLAAAWVASGEARPDTLVTHFRSAGDRDRTIDYATIAAAAANEALAFDRAAGYYQLLIEVDAPERRGHWYAQLGDALALAGRGREAATASLIARRDAAVETATELERRAAEQLIRSGYLEDAREVVDSLLARVGVRAPRTSAGAFAGLVARRLFLAILGTDVRERAERDIPVEELRRIDTLWSIGAPLSLVDLVRGNNLHLRSMWMVLRSGEPTRLVRALSTLACTSAIDGPRHDARTTRILTQAQALAARLDDPAARARTVLAEGICHKVTGRWVIARECLERAITQLLPCPGVRWEIETARTLLHDALFWMGEWQQLFREIPARRQEAEERGDLYGATHVAVRLAPVAHLAADDPERARAEAAAGMARWPSRSFDLQHRFEVCSLLEADLYAGHGEEAWRRLHEAWPRLRWTLYAFQNARIEMRFLRARIALLRATGGDTAWLRCAEREATRLERERAPWATALAAHVRGCASVARGQRTQAVPTLQSAEQLLRDAAMLHYAAAAQYRRGEAAGDGQGRALMASARSWLVEQGVVNPERMVGLLAPIGRQPQDPRVSLSL